MTSCLLLDISQPAIGAGGIELLSVIALTVIACLAVDNVNVLETISKNSRPLPGIIAAVLQKNAVSLRETQPLTDTEIQYIIISLVYEAASFTRVGLTYVWM